MNVWDAIQTKRAIRQFTDAHLPAHAVTRILDAGRRAQSAKNSQPWDFIAIQDRETLTRLAQTGDWMGHVAGAALCVVLVSPGPADNERYPWHMFDLGQAAAYMQLAAHEIGIASCPGTIYDEALAHEILGIPSGKSARLVLSFGYPAPDAQARGLGKQGRRTLDDVVHRDRW